MRTTMHCYERINECSKEKAKVEFSSYTDTKVFDDIEIRYLRKSTKRKSDYDEKDSHVKFADGYYRFDKKQGLFGIPVWYSCYYLEVI
jgi:hypothetical protein